MATPCPRAADGQHEPLKKAFMCQGCDLLSDCAATLQQAPCPSPIPTPPAPEIKAMTKASPPVSLEPPEKRARTLEALKDAEMKLAHLVMLKGLENERLKLQQLLAAKHQAKSGENGSEAAIKICMHAFASFETRSIYIYIYYRQPRCGQHRNTAHGGCRSRSVRCSFRILSPRTPGQKPCFPRLAKVGRWPGACRWRGWVHRALNQRLAKATMELLHWNTRLVITDINYTIDVISTAL